MSSDWELARSARNGSESAWRKLIEIHHDRLIRMTFLITGSMPAAQDVVQETFVRLLQKKPKHFSGSFSGYLTTIAYRLALKEKKRQGRIRPLDSTDEVTCSPTPMDDVLNSERDRIIANAIRTLNDIHRDIIVLRFYGGHSYEAIANMLNVPVGTVKSRIFYAIKKCGEIIKRELPDETL